MSELLQKRLKIDCQIILAVIRKCAKLISSAQGVIFEGDVSEDGRAGSSSTTSTEYASAASRKGKEACPDASPERAAKVT